MVLHDTDIDHVASYHMREPTRRRLNPALPVCYDAKRTDTIRQKCGRHERNRGRLVPPPSELVRCYKKQVLFRIPSNESLIYIYICFALFLSGDAGRRLSRCGPLSLRGVLAQLDTPTPDYVHNGYKSRF